MTMFSAMSQWLLNAYEHLIADIQLTPCCAPWMITGTQTQGFGAQDLMTRYAEWYRQLMYLLVVFRCRCITTIDLS